MFPITNAFDEYRMLRAIRDLFNTNRLSGQKIIYVKVSKYPGGLRQLVSDLCSIYSG